MSGPRPSARQQATGALQRIQQLEEAIPEVVTAINQRMNQQQNQISSYAEVVDAIIGMLGADLVKSTIQANRIERQIEQANLQKEKVSKGVEAGRLVPVTEITDQVEDAPGSFVEGVEYDAQGQEIPPGYIFLRIAEIVAETRAMLIGKGPGTEVPTYKVEDGAMVRDENGAPVLSGGRFIVTAVYDIAQKPVETPVAVPTSGDMLPEEAVEVAAEVPSNVIPLPVAETAAPAQA